MLSRLFLQKKYCKQTVEIQKICCWVENLNLNYLHVFIENYLFLKKNYQHIQFTFTTFYIEYCEYWMHGTLLSLLLHKYAKIERVLQVSTRLDKSGSAFHFIQKWCALLFLALLRWTFYYISKDTLLCSCSDIVYKREQVFI